MRTAVIVGGLAIAGCLGALGAVEAEKLNSLSASLWPKLLGEKVAKTTTAAAPVEPARPAAPRIVVSDAPPSTPALPVPAAAPSPIRSVA